MPELDRSHKLSTWARQVHIPPAHPRAGSAQLRRRALQALVDVSLFGEHPGFVDTYPYTIPEWLGVQLGLSLGSAQRLFGSLAAGDLIEVRRRPLSMAYAARIDSPHTCKCGAEPLGMTGAQYVAHAMAAR